MPSSTPVSCDNELPPVQRARSSAKTSGVHWPHRILLSSCARERQGTEEMAQFRVDRETNAENKITRGKLRTAGNSKIAKVALDRFWKLPKSFRSNIVKLRPLLSPSTDVVQCSSATFMHFRDFCPLVPKKSQPKARHVPKANATRYTHISFRLP